jgi:hypothetical protein
MAAVRICSVKERKVSDGSTINRQRFAPQPPDPPEPTPLKRAFALFGASDTSDAL